MGKLTNSIRDLIRSSQMHRIWLFMGGLEVKQRYRRSVLGPWWISLNMLIFVLCMSVVFSKLFHQNVKEYIPFFTAGYLAWILISTCINEATELFRSNVGFIKQISLPYNVYIFKHLTRQLTVFFHNFVVFLLIAIILNVPIGWKTFLVIPGILLLTLNLYWMSLLTGLISLRFRDMAPIINNFMQVIFFITPISWMPKLLGPDSLIIALNPFVYFIDLIRTPLLSGSPSIQSWYISILITLFGITLSLFLFSRVRHRIAFWID